MAELAIYKKAFDFAVIAIRIVKAIQKVEKEYVVSRQFVRAATSIGANIQEARGAQSQKDFFTKLCISYKEARESKYWIELLYSAQLIERTQYDTLISQVEQIIKMLGAAKVTTEKKLLLVEK